MHFELTDKGGAVHNASIRGRVPVASGDHLEASIDGRVLGYLEVVGSLEEYRRLVIIVLHRQQNQRIAISGGGGEVRNIKFPNAQFVYKTTPIQIRALLQ